MAKKRRQAKIPTPAWERPRGTIGQRILGRSFQFYGAIAIGVLMVIGVGVVVYAFLADELEERRRPGSIAIQIDDASFDLDYFSRRLEMFLAQFGGQNPEAIQPATAVPAVSEVLVQEEIVRRFAGEADVTAGEDEVQEGIADRLGVDVEVETFDVVFEQELARSGLSEQEYRLMVQASVLEQKLREHFEEEVPKSAESVNYRQILVSEQEKADELVADIEDGGDFADLAAQDFNLDAANKENGGAVGWVPRGFLDASMEELVFALEPGEVSTIPSPRGVFVIEMQEKSEDRAIDEEAVPQLALGAFNAWVQEKRQAIEIQNLVLSDGGKCDWAVSRAYGAKISCGI